MHTIWSEEEVSLLKSLYPFKSKQEILDGFPNRSWSAIQTKAYKLRLCLDKIINNPHKKDLLDLSVIDTQEKAYLLGFIAADGCVHDNNKFHIHLAYKDLVHLEKLRDVIYPNASIYNYKNISVKLEFKDAIFRDQLRDHGITKGKTYNLQPPTTVPLYLLRHWVRGYFDGDGSIMYIRKNKTNPRCYVCGMEKEPFNPVLMFISDQFKIFHKCDCDPSLQREKSSNKIIYDGKKGICFINWIYKDATIYLDRKYELIKPRLLSNAGLNRFKNRCHTGDKRARILYQ